MKRIASATFFSIELEEADFDKTFRDFDPEELLSAKFFPPQSSKRPFSRAKTTEF